MNIMAAAREGSVKWVAFGNEEMRVRIVGGIYIFIITFL